MCKIILSSHLPCAKSRLECSASAHRRCKSVSAPFNTTHVYLCPLIIKPPKTYVPGRCGWAVLLSALVIS